LIPLLSRVSDHLGYVS